MPRAVAGDGDVEALAVETDDESVDEGLLVLCEEHRDRVGCRVPRRHESVCLPGLASIVTSHISLWARQGEP